MNDQNCKHEFNNFQLYKELFLELSPSEISCVCLISEISDKKTIASLLNITTKTLNNRLKNIYEKLDVYNFRDFQLIIITRRKLYITNLVNELLEEKQFFLNLQKDFFTKQQGIIDILLSSNFNNII